MSDGTRTRRLEQDAQRVWQLRQDVVSQEVGNLAGENAASFWGSGSGSGSRRWSRDWRRDLLFGRGEFSLTTSRSLSCVLYRVAPVSSRTSHHSPSAATSGAGIDLATPSAVVKTSTQALVRFPFLEASYHRFFRIYAHVRDFRFFTFLPSDALLRCCFLTTLSYLHHPGSGGVFSHFSSYCLQRSWFSTLKGVCRKWKSGMIVDYHSRYDIIR